jgi:protocatechuate 3,4-dioxygenase beta subunit
VDASRRKPEIAISAAIAAGAVLLVLFPVFSPSPREAGEARGDARCVPTPPDMEGPFYRPGAPEKTSTGTGLVVRGRVLGAPDCRPLPGSRVEWWHAGPSGDYDGGHRGSLKADPAGAYRFSTDYPGKYPWRPTHIHFKAFAPGYRDLTTQLYLRKGEKEVEFDIVLSPAR